MAVANLVLVVSGLGLLLMQVTMVHTLHESRGSCSQKSRKRFPHSCLDVYNNGNKENGYYHIYKENNCDTTSFIVYCDMTSERGSVWTLIESFAFTKANQKEFRTTRLGQNAPVNDRSPNWDAYRMTSSNMIFLKSNSTHWRITCNFNQQNFIDYEDYVRGKLGDFDIINYIGGGQCKKVEYISIRGVSCAFCTSMWWQYNHEHLHLDSSGGGCDFGPVPGHVHSEDNFGHYAYTNKKFRCTSSPNSVTSVWLGNYV